MDSKWVMIYREAKVEYLKLCTNIRPKRRLKLTLKTVAVHFPETLVSPNRSSPRRPTSAYQEEKFHFFLLIQKHKYGASFCFSIAVTICLPAFFILCPCACYKSSISPISVTFSFYSERSITLLSHLCMNSGDSHRSNVFHIGIEIFIAI